MAGSRFSSRDPRVGLLTRSRVPHGSARPTQPVDPFRDGPQTSWSSSGVTSNAPENPSLIHAANRRLRFHDPHNLSRIPHRHHVAALLAPRRAADRRPSSRRPCDGPNGTRSRSPGRRGGSRRDRRGRGNLTMTATRRADNRFALHAAREHTIDLTQRRGATTDHDHHGNLVLTPTSARHDILTGNNDAAPSRGEATTASRPAAATRCRGKQRHARWNTARLRHDERDAGADEVEVMAP